MSLDKVNGKLVVEVYSWVKDIKNPPLEKLHSEFVKTEFPTKKEFLLMCEGRKFHFPERDWEILNYRFQGNIKAECARKFNLSSERIREIENRFMRMMRRKIAKERLKDQ